MADIKKPVVICGPGRTKQSFREECNIHTIMKKYRQTGLLSHVTATPPMWGDFVSVPDYQSALEKVKLAEEAFMALPAFVRSRFENDPAQLLAFVSDSKNRDEAVKLGLVVEAVKPPVVETPVDASSESKPA